MIRKEKTQQHDVLGYDYEQGLAALSSEWWLDVKDINHELVKKHQFPDAEAHAFFLLNASHIFQGFSEITVENGEVSIPTDMTSFKHAKQRFDRLAEKLNSVSEMLYEMRCDATMEMLLTHFGNEQMLTQVHRNVADLIGVAAKVEALRGKTGKPVKGKWVKDFCIYCQRFWYEQRNEKTRIAYASNGAPATAPIAKWIEDVAAKMDEKLGRSQSITTIKTIAKNLPKYRP